jgi:peptidoglycan/xylan/chitin deacetylase (PgdA/CDA1 family)
VSLKRTLKRGAQTVVASVAPWLWRRRGGSLLVMMYHRVLPAGHPERLTEQPGMYVSPETLALHLQLIRAHFEVVQLDDWLRLESDGRALPALACAITFDDGWRDNYDHAFPVLRAAGVPSTIYLVSDLVGTSYSFWPNALARLLADASPSVLARLPEWLRQVLPANGSRALDGVEIDRVICICKDTRSDAEMLAMLREFEVPSSTGGSRDLMSWEEIADMQRSGLVRFGSHTRRHTRLSRVATRSELEDEIIGSRRRIEEQIGVQPQTFCYPNGDTSPEAIACVRSAYLGAVTTAPGWNSRGADRAALRRLGVHDDVSATRASFLSRISGFG